MKEKNNMETRLNQHIELLIKRYPELELAKDSVIAAYNIMEECLITAENS